VKKHVNKVPGIIVRAYSGGQYTVVLLAGESEGQVQQVAVDRIEPFFVREGSIHSDMISKIRNNITKKVYDTYQAKDSNSKKRKAGSDLVPKKTQKKPRITTPVLDNSGMSKVEPKKREVELESKERSESHQWKLACIGEELQPRQARQKQRISVEFN
jgi:hypothetical protein